MRFLIGLVPLALLLSGCGQSEYTISGVVRFPDGTPLVYGNVIVESAQLKVGGSGSIKPDGTFTIQHLPAGEYAVYITHAFAPGTTPDPGAIAKRGGPPLPGSLIDPKFTLADTSGLTVTVPAGPIVELQVEKPGKAEK